MRESKPAGFVARQRQAELKAAIEAETRPAVLAKRAARAAAAAANESAKQEAASREAEAAHQARVTASKARLDAAASGDTADLAIRLELEDLRREVARLTAETAAIRTAIDHAPTARKAGK